MFIRLTHFNRNCQRTSCMLTLTFAMRCIFGSTVIQSRGISGSRLRKSMSISSPYDMGIFFFFILRLLEWHAMSCFDITSSHCTTWLNGPSSSCKATDIGPMYLKVPFLPEVRSDCLTSSSIQFRLRLKSKDTMNWGCPAHWRPTCLLLRSSLCHKEWRRCLWASLSKFACCSKKRKIVWSSSLRGRPSCWSPLNENNNPNHTSDE